MTPCDAYARRLESHYIIVLYMYKNIPSQSEYLTIILNENLLSYKSNGPAGSPSSSSSSDSMNVIL